MIGGFSAICDAHYLFNPKAKSDGYSFINHLDT